MGSCKNLECKDLNGTNFDNQNLERKKLKLEIYKSGTPYFYLSINLDDTNLDCT